MEPVRTRSDLSRPIGTRQNPFRLTRLNLSKHVSIRSNLLKHVQINTFPLLPSSPPSYPLPFPLFFGGGGREGGKHHHQKPPGRGRGGDEVPPPPPPPQDFNNNNKKQNSLTLSSLCCVIYPRGFSQSTAAAQNYINTYGDLSTKFIVAY